MSVGLNQKFIKMNMWNNLKIWQKILSIYTISFVILYVLGRLFVPIQALDNLENYKFPPFLYSTFLILPILLMKYSYRKSTKVIASIILSFFLLFVLFSVFFILSEVSDSNLGFSSNPLTWIITLLYTAPLMGGIVLAVMMFGGM
jgi:hypothetical protein